MKKTARRLFNVHSGEERKVTLFALLGFVISLAVSSAWKLSDALFLIHLGSELLPQAYACTATLLIGMALVLLRAFNHYSPTSIFRAFIICGMTFFALIASSFLLGFEKQHTWFWFALKVLSQLFFFQTISCYWTALDQYVHFQDAKRLFTLFNCSIYIGTAFAGLLIQSGIIPIHSFFMMIFLLWCCVFVLSHQLTSFSPTSCEHEAVHSEASSLTEIWKQILRSPFTIVLMLGNLTLYLLMTTTEYNYFRIFDAHFNGQTELMQDESAASLTRFMGSCIASVGLGNLIMGWFLYSRFVARFGVTSLVFITPVAYVATYLGWPLDASILFAIMGFVIVEGLYPVIDDNNFNLLLNAVPKKIKYKVRVMIESFSEPVGMLLSALLLSLPMVNNYTLGLILALAALLIAFLQRTGYFQAIFSNLSGIKDSQSFFKRGRIESEQQIMDLVRQSDPKLQLLAFRACIYSDNLSLLKRALAVCQHLQTATRIELLHLLDRSPYRTSSAISESILTWQESDADDDLAAAINWYIAKCPFENKSTPKPVPS